MSYDHQVKETVTIEIAKLCLETNDELNSKESPKLRGYVASRFRDCELAHNHDLDNGKCKYHYPLIQYKIINGKAIILAIGTEAIEILKDMFCGIRHLKIHRRTLHIEQSEMEINECHIGISGEMLSYTLVTPWLALNANNYKNYLKAEDTEKQQILSRCLIGNLLSMSKFLNYHVSEKIQVRQDVYPQNVRLKGQNMIGFVGTFSTNFHLPDFIGIGKSCSRGYGCCAKVHI